MRISVESCPVCQSRGRAIGDLRSPFSHETFSFALCDACGFTYITDPRVDFDKLYDADYYDGRGADRNVDYLREMTDPATLRRYEWDGILRAVTSITGTRELRWLDLGCGLGGLVRHLRANGVTDAWGSDEGYAADWMREHDVPSLTTEELADHAGSFDVVTAIEVIEHVTDPVGLMTSVSQLLKPGGLFFLTTGNAQPHLDHFLKWSYVNCDVHVGYFQPRTLAAVYEKVGLIPEHPGFLPGWDDIIRYKVLKSLKLRRTNLLEAALPWRTLVRPVDHRHRVTAHPIARKPA